MRNKHRKRAVRFLLFFAVVLIFDIADNFLAASILGVSSIFEAVILMIGIAFVFTLITELIEEEFEGGEQPLEDLLKTLTHLEKHKIPPTYHNIRKHLKTKN